MSAQAVHDFWQRVGQDPGLRQRLQGVTTDNKEAATAAVDHLMAEWQRFAALHADDEEIDDHDVEGERAEASADEEIG